MFSAIVWGPYTSVNTIVSQGIDPGYSRLPQSVIIIFFSVYFVYCRPWVLEIFSSAPGWLWWPIAKVVLTIRFPIMWLGDVWEPAPPPPQYGHWTAYLTPLFELNPQIPLRCRMDLWLARLVLTQLQLHQPFDTTPFCNCKFGAYSKLLSFFQPWCFSLAGCLFPF